MAVNNSLLPTMYKFSLFFVPKAVVQCDRKNNPATLLLNKIFTITYMIFPANQLTYKLLYLVQEGNFIDPEIFYV